jgi:hypothetical protein
VFRPSKVVALKLQHEERELCSRLGQNVSRVGEWNPVAVRIRAVDVIKTAAIWATTFSVPLLASKTCVNLVAKGCNQPSIPERTFR